MDTNEEHSDSVSNEILVFALQLGLADDECNIDELSSNLNKLLKKADNCITSNPDEVQLRLSIIRNLFAVYKELTRRNHNDKIHKYEIHGGRIGPLIERTDQSLFAACES